MNREEAIEALVLKYNNWTDIESLPDGLPIVFQWVWMKGAIENYFGKYKPIGKEAFDAEKGRVDKLDRDAIDGIMDHFDFSKVDKIMRQLDWKWAFEEDTHEDTGTPTESAIRVYARKALNRCKSSVYGGFYSGGFEATYEDGTYNLKFVIEDWHEEVVEK